MFRKLMKIASVLSKTESQGSTTLRNFGFGVTPGQTGERWTRDKPR
jgi:hypothetical protein